MKSIESYFDPFPVLETERLLLRPITYADLDEMYRYCAVPAVSEYTTWDAHQSEEDTAKVMEKTGMKFEGLLRSYMKIKNEMQDLNLYAMTRGDYDSNVDMIPNVHNVISSIDRDPL